MGSVRNPHGCYVIGCGEATRIDVPRFCFADRGAICLYKGEERPRRWAGPARERGRTHTRRPALSRSSATQTDASGQAATCKPHAERHAGIANSGSDRTRQSCREQTLKRSASNRARCATTGAGWCNSILRPNPAAACWATRKRRRGGNAPVTCYPAKVGKVRPVGRIERAQRVPRRKASERTVTCEGCKGKPGAAGTRRNPGSMDSSTL